MRRRHEEFADLNRMIEEAQEEHEALNLLNRAGSDRRSPSGVVGRRKDRTADRVRELLSRTEERAAAPRSAPSDASVEEELDRLRQEVNALRAEKASRMQQETKDNADASEAESLRERVRRLERDNEVC